MKRIAELDGWRGIAILLVLVDHLQWQWLGNYYRPWASTGQHGVTIFFVLSGYLITRILLDRSADLRGFYLRRMFRLAPAAWSYLAVLVALGVLYPANAMNKRELVGCLFFFRNYLQDNMLLSAPHFWSLSIEEQFYIVWPAVLLLWGRKRASFALAATTLAAVFLRHHFHDFYNRVWFNFRTEVRADALCVGCLTAILLSYPTVRHKAFEILPKISIPAFIILLCCVLLCHMLPPIIESCAIASLIACSVLHSGMLHFRVLSFAPLAWLGRISYSVYIWQQFIHTNHGFSSNILIDCVVIVLCLSSYYLIEKPCVALGAKFSKRFSPSSNEAPMPVKTIGTSPSGSLGAPIALQAQEEDA